MLKVFAPLVAELSHLSWHFPFFAFSISSIFHSLYFQRPYAVKDGTVMSF